MAHDISFLVANSVLVEDAPPRLVEDAPPRLEDAPTPIRYNDYSSPPGLYKPIIQSQQQFIHSNAPLVRPIAQVADKYTPFEPTSEIKNRLEDELFIAKQKVAYLENELQKINKQPLIKQTPTQQPLIKQITNINKPSPEFINAIYNLFSLENNIQLSNIPHRLPKNLLPPIGKKGLFTSWLDQVPNLNKKIRNVRHPDGRLNKEYVYYI